MVLFTAMAMVANNRQFCYDVRPFSVVVNAITYFLPVVRSEWSVSTLSIL